MHLATAHKYHLKRTLSHSVVVLSDFFFIFTYGSNSFEKWMFEQVTTSWICYFTMSLKSLVKTNDVKLLKNGEVKEGELAMPITHAFFKPHYMLSLFWQYAKNSPLWRPLLNSLQFKLQYLISIRKGISKKGFQKVNKNLHFPWRAKLAEISRTIFLKKYFPIQWNVYLNTWDRSHPFLIYLLSVSPTCFIAHKTHYKMKREKEILKKF